MNERFLCVMVTYNPETNGLRESINSVLANNVDLIIVDNGSAKPWEKQVVLPDSVVLVKLPENQGIAAAQNHGIKHAQKNGYDFVWVSDQDTIYPADYVLKILECWKTLNNDEKAQIAALGPSFFDTNRGSIQPIVDFHPFTTKRMPEKGLNLVSHMIASGMIIPARSFDIVGLKQEDLFIDWVDMEWCWRASNLYEMKLYVCGDVVIQHTLGDSNVSFLGKKLILRSPFRHYFMIRNAVALALYSKSVGFFIRLELFFKAIVWMTIFPILDRKNSKAQFMAVTRGFIDGLKNRLGAKSG